MSYGGKREGAGRKKGSKAAHTLEAQEARKILIARLHEELRPIVDALIKKAKGGDIPAIRELLDRAWGKSIESVDITSKGEPITGFNYLVPKNDSDDSSKS